tara:strand:+ start:146 stop:676 length:531 start_codon:yes stop_codon:yes gene_type:complete
VLNERRAYDLKIAFAGAQLMPEQELLWYAHLMKRKVLLQISLISPPSGYVFCLQKGKGNDAKRLDYVRSTDDDLAFELEVDVREGKVHGSANFLGPFVQGSVKERFFYIVVGSCNEVGEPTWFGRVKVPLSTIDWATVEASSGKKLEACYDATGPKGTPALATVHLIDGWQITADE